jgi:hypothetical protein
MNNAIKLYYAGRSTFVVLDYFLHINVCVALLQVLNVADEMIEKGAGAVHRLEIIQLSNFRKNCLYRLISSYLVSKRHKD